MYSPCDSRINWTSLLCFFFDWQVTPEFSFDGRSHIQLQLLWSLPARRTQVQIGVRTRALTGVILSLLSQEQSEYLRLEVSHSWSLAFTLTAAIVLFVSLKLGPVNDCSRCLSGCEWVISGLETYGWILRGLLTDICMFLTGSLTRSAECLFGKHFIKHNRPSLFKVIFASG